MKVQAASLSLTFINSSLTYYKLKFFSLMLASLKINFSAQYLLQLAILLKEWKLFHHKSKLLRAYRSPCVEKLLSNLRRVGLERIKLIRFHTISQRDSVQATLSKVIYCNSDSFWNEFFSSLALYLSGKADVSYTWALYLLFHVHFSLILHTISISLTVTLAVWRYIAIK